MLEIERDGEDERDDDDDVHARPDDVDPRIGQTIAGRYQIVRPVSAGGMGTVYEALDLELGAQIAIKILHAEYARRPRVVQRFIREARVVGTLANAHIVQVTDSGEWAGLPYFVMELLRGKDLRQLLSESKKLTIARAASLLLDVCRGLHAAHQADVVHRDLKPANIFITSEAGREVAKILDFGVAKLRNAADTTGEGTLIGTVRYMAPEQVISSKDADHRSDVYALGAIFHEMLTGEPVHRGEKAEVIFQILYGSLPALGSRGQSMPSAVRDTIARAMARDPKERYQSVAELAGALELMTRWIGKEDPTSVSAEVHTAADATTSPDAETDTGSGTSLQPHDATLSTSKAARRRRMTSVALVLALSCGALWSIRTRHRANDSTTAPVATIEQAALRGELRATDPKPTLATATSTPVSLDVPPSRAHAEPPKRDPKPPQREAPKADLERTIPPPEMSFDKVNPYASSDRAP